MVRSLLPILFLLTACQQSENPNALPADLPKDQCEIDRVIDGDTVHVTCTNADGNLRLMGFDTPETFRSGCDAEKALGKKATAHLQMLLDNATVIDTETSGFDKYRRLLSKLYIDGIDVAELMIEAKLAVPYHGEKRINWCDRLAK